MPIPGLIPVTSHRPAWRHIAATRRRRPPRRRWPRRLLLAATALTVVGALFVMALAAWLANDLPDPDRLMQRVVPLTTKLYDRTGQTVLFEIHGPERRTLVKLSDIPDYVTGATIAAEDHDFYQHRGFRIRSMVRAAIANVLSSGRAQGGSTLTQQFVKNAILTGEKTYTRKFKELLLAIQIERRFSKDQILQLYFNEIPYGKNAYGAQAAAETYFGHGVNELTVAEAAILAAMTQRPTYLSPYGSHRDELIARQRYILNTMVTEGYLTAAQAKAAKAEKLTFRQLTDNILAPHFSLALKELLSAKYGERTVETGGLHVITTLDLAKQKLAETAIAEGAEKNKKLGAGNAALLALDAGTGQVLAMLGSRDFFNEEIDGQVNVATRPRQPGSSFKPVVYAAAFRLGYTPETVLYDVVTPFVNYDGAVYEPKNYTLKEYGPVTMRQALAGSLNIPAVKTIYLTGIGNVLQLAEELGYTTLQPRSRFGLSLVLGGGEVTLLEHVGAFATFASEGEYRPVTSILKVTDQSGQVLEEFRDQPRKVLGTQVARQINAILSDNAARTFIFGAQSALILPDRPVAAKTGTTNDYKDAWAIGFTPSLAAGVWVGNSRGEEMKRGADGSVVAAPIWQRFMREALMGTPVQEFQQPDPVVTGKPALDGTIKDGLKVIVDRASGKLATDLTPATYREERTYMVPHTILHYLLPDDPRGPEPMPGQRNAQYAAWEAAVQRWASVQQLVISEPPTDDDDVHLPALVPTVRLVSPSDGERWESRQLHVQAWAAAPRGVRRIVYRISDQPLGTAWQEPFALDFFLDSAAVANGLATVSATAYDDVDNAASATATVLVDLPPLARGIGWDTPADGAILEAKLFPLTLQLTLARPGRVKQVDVAARGPDGTTYFINSIRQIREVVTTPWVRPPTVGIFRLSATVTNADGFQYPSDELTVEVK